MGKDNVQVVICGAGMAGVSAAYHLTVKEGMRNVLIVDERSPLTLTSDKSTEAYRNWWPGPGDTMVRFMNHSIDLLDELARESKNVFNMNRRGYVFLTASPEQATRMEQSAGEISGLGAGPFRYHQGRGDDPPYPERRAEGFGPDLNGADFFVKPEMIRKEYPFITNRAIAMLHPRRCGWLSAQQLGMVLLERAKAAGARYLMGRMTGVVLKNDRVAGVEIKRDSSCLDG